MYIYMLLLLLMVDKWTLVDIFVKAGDFEPEFSPFREVDNFEKGRFLRLVLLSSADI